jgi:hypothetical protein
MDPGDAVVVAPSVASVFSALQCTLLTLHLGIEGVVGAVSVTELATSAGLDNGLVAKLLHHPPILILQIRTASMQAQVSGMQGTQTPGEEQKLTPVPLVANQDENSQGASWH